ncbi:MULTISPECIES: TPR domain-containing glycosyltransferase [Brevibacillus]|jgi:glycosyltransferase involved in cell wall biosynthesis|uniref:tetratricopeptide repeat-containing glycosyltransferase family 2 protein n=1 Tax=Brevibacillus TaxID=55080 RepID=UPI001E5D7827|nr:MULTISPECIES: TPR domain-containing glycosyltransferase [Bacillales]MDT3417897.1 glycosyltransferase involved in cell wall biosynthesis [Brevibacillus aydinogluensis]UFJ61947.1 glycosyltransferase [Anoxybacillus sediminis]
MRISACVITKNEEKNLPSCLESVRKIVSEIIVVDTGSTDRTIEVARQYGAAVFHFEWIDDFAAAKNYALSKATGDWIVFLDADEQLSRETIPNVYDVINHAQNGNYDLIAGLITDYDPATHKALSTLPTIRIFRNDPCIRYTGAIHERLVKSNGTPTIYNATDRIIILHSGYTRSAITEKEKSKRNLSILLKEWGKNPCSSDLAFYISEAYLIGRDYKQALEYASKMLTYQNATLYGLYEKNYINIIHCMTELNYPPQKILETIKKAVQAYPDFPDFYFYLGDVYRKANRYHDAIEAFEIGLTKLNNALSSQSGTVFNTPNVLAIVGSLYYSLGHISKSVEYYVQSLHLDKYNYQVLIELLKTLSHFEETGKIISFLEKIYNADVAKDTLLLVSASIEIKNTSLAEHYLAFLDPFQVEELSAYRGQLKLLKGSFDEAAAIFQERYCKHGDIQDAVCAITGVILSNDSRCFKNLVDILPPSLQSLLNKDINNIDPSELLLLVSTLIRLRCWEVMMKYVDIIEHYGLLIETAECFYRNEEYGLAFEFYKYYLEKVSDVPTSNECIILIKMADCLYNTGDLLAALELLSQAQEMNPHEYAVYERQLGICIKLNDQEKTKQVVQTALLYYPDSSYLLSLD